MAASGFTPISLYHSTSAAAVPVNTNLVAGELAINVTDGKLFYKDNSNVVQVIGWKTVPASAGGTGQTSLTANNVILGNGTSAVQFVAPGSSGNVLTSNGTTWTSAAAASLSGITQSVSPFETALGHQAGNVNTGVNNTFIGYQAGLLNTTGTSNVALGHQALDSNTGGAGNVAIGANALAANTNANFNIAVGYFALLSNTTGTNNIAIGANTLDTNTTGSNNVAVGGAALDANTIGSNNVAVGSFAILSNTTGVDNTAVGYESGDKITTGTQNVTIGSSAASSGTNDLTTGSNNIIIGYNAAASSATVSNEVTLGNSSITNNRLFGNVTLANGDIRAIKTATFNSQTTIATTSGSITVDWTTAQNQRQTEPTGTITYTFTAPPGPCHLQLLIDSDGTSTAQTINFPGSVTFLGSTWAGANNKKAVINFWYDGTNYLAVGTNQV